MRIEVRTAAEVGEVSRALQLANRRRLEERQADGWAERDALRLAQRAQGLVSDPASRAAANDPWKGAVPEFEPVPESRARRFGKGILVTAAGEYVDGKLKAKASPFQGVFFSSWGKVYSGYLDAGGFAFVPVPWSLSNQIAFVEPSYNSAPIEGYDTAEWPPPIPQPPRWTSEPPGGYANFDQGQIFGEGTPVVLYNSGAGQTAAVGWVFGSNFDPEHPLFSRFDLTNAYRDIATVPNALNKLVSPALTINGGGEFGPYSLPPLQNPAAAAKNYNQLTFEFICSAGGARLDIECNNIELTLQPGTYSLQIGPARKQSDPPGPPGLANTSGQVSTGTGELHHYAVTINNGVAFFHVDGRLADSYDLASTFWTEPRGYAGATYQSGDWPIMIKAAVRYKYTEQQITTWYPASLTFYAGTELEETITGYVPYVSYALTQAIPGIPPAAIQSMRFTPRALYTNQDFEPPAIITSLRA